MKFPSVEGNESEFQIQCPQSGGAATIIAAQGFNPGFRISLKVQKGGALARGLAFEAIFE